MRLYADVHPADRRTHVAVADGGKPRASFLKCVVLHYGQPAVAGPAVTDIHTRDRGWQAEHPSGRLDGPLGGDLDDGIHLRVTCKAPKGIRLCVGMVRMVLVSFVYARA